MAFKSYVCLTSVCYAGVDERGIMQSKRYEIGEIIRLDDATAAQALESKSIKLAEVQASSRTAQG